MDFGKKNRVGNYYLLKVNEGGFPYIKAGDIAESWSVKFAYTHVMFATLERLVDEEQINAIAALLTTWFGVCSILDAEFTKNVFDEIDGFVNRRADISESTEEEKKEMDILSDMEQKIKEES